MRSHNPTKSFANRNTHLYAALFFFLFAACSSFDREEEVQKILEIHRAQRDHHFNAEAEAFVRQLTADFVSVNRGVVTEPTFRENVDRFDDYTNSVRFLKWDDLVKPIVRFSDDGSMAYTIVRKMVEIKLPGIAGDSVVEQTAFAWTSIYKKTDDGWKIESVTSTNKPPEYLPGKRQRLLMKLDEFDRAFVDADTVKLDRLIASDYVHTNGNNDPIDRKTWLDYMASRKKALENGSLEILDYRASKRNITHLGNTAVVNTRVDSEQILNGRRSKSAFQVTQVWKDENGIWKRAAFHDGKIR